MSSDNAIYIKNIGKVWFVREGSASVEYGDDYFKAPEAIGRFSRDEAIILAHEMAYHTEYGAIELDDSSEFEKCKADFFYWAENYLEPKMTFTEEQKRAWRTYLAMIDSRKAAK